MKNEKSEFHNNLPWLDQNTILYVRHGSRAYGTNTPTSDEDFKGVAIAPKAFYFGFTKKWEQAESKDPDSVTYELRKFLALAADCNPNIIEVLWVDPSDRVKVSPIGELLLEHRQAFLSKRVRHTFCGYAVSQLNRIRGHRRWLLNPPTHQPLRSEFDLPERTLVPADQLLAATAAIQKEIDSWELDLSGLDDATRLNIMRQIEKHIAYTGMTADEKFLRAGRLLSFDDNMLLVLERERRYASALKDWRSYQDWKKNRNPDRAAIEAKYGLDLKHGYHLVRLLRMCREILTEGVVRVRRPDAEELLAIRHGAWSYDQLVEWAEREDAAMQELYKTSSLPKVPKLEDLDDLCQMLLETFWRG